MERALLFPFAGAGIGFLVAVAIVRIMAGPSPSSDTTAITLFVGTFLAGSGTIAGAILGAVEFCKRREPSRESQIHGESEV
jgi:hypothetical protein